MASVRHARGCNLTVPCACQKTIVFPTIRRRCCDAHACFQPIISRHTFPHLPTSVAVLPYLSTAYLYLQ
jgi:hypothetical protein